MESKSSKTLSSSIGEKIKENKKVILVLEWAVFIAALVVSIAFRHIDGYMIVYQVSDCIFAAALVAAISSTVNINVKTAYESTISDLEEEYNRANQKYESEIKMNSESLSKSVSDLQDVITKYELTSKKLQQFLANKCMFCKSCFVSIYQNREEANLPDFFNKAKKEICILVTSLNSLEGNQYYHLFKDKARNGVNVKICTLDLSSNAGVEFNRTRKTGNAATPTVRFQNMKNSLETYLRENLALIPNAGSNVDSIKHDVYDGAMKIRAYKVTPTMIMFIADDECIVSFMLDNTQSRDVIHLHLKLDEVFAAANQISANVFKNHFDNIFENAAGVTISDVSRW